MTILLFGESSDNTKPRVSEAGNIMLMLFATIGMVGIVGATSMSIMKGPVRSMHNVTQRTIAENNMIASGKLSLMWAGSQIDGGDCDADGATEPPAWSTSGTGPFPTGGGYLPSNIGASLLDPWGNTYGYCSWDHGSSIQKTTPAPNCPTPMQRLQGTLDSNGIVVAIISAGPDKIFQTSCANAPAFINKVTGSDDIIMSYTFGEAAVQSGGLWKLKAGQATTAEIGDRDIEIKGSGGSSTAKIGYDAGLGISGVGDFMAIKTDFLHAKTANAPISVESGLRLKNVSGLSAPETSAGGGGGAAPTGAVMAFDLTTCPTGWSEYTAARGRFIRGIDNGAGNDPDGTRALGSTQADANKSHTHTGTAASAGSHTHTGSTASAGSHTHTLSGRGDQNAHYQYGAQLSGVNNVTTAGAINAAGDHTHTLTINSDGAHTHSLTLNADGAAEARPKNVALLYCRKD